MNNRLLVIDLFIVWCILAPIVLIVFTFWLDDRINKLQKELYDIRDILGKRISNVRNDLEQEVLIRIDSLEDAESEISALADEIHSLQIATSNPKVTVPSMFYTYDDVFEYEDVKNFEADPGDDPFDDELFDERVHEAIDSIDKSFDEVMTDDGD